MKTLEVIRKMDGFEKRLANLKKEFDNFKDKVDNKESKIVDTPKPVNKKKKIKDED